MHTYNNDYASAALQYASMRNSATYAKRISNDTDTRKRIANTEITIVAIVYEISNALLQNSDTL